MELVDFIVDLITIITQGLGTFVDFIIGLPTMFYNFITLVPSPLSIVLNAFISFIILIIFLKVVRLIVG